MIDTQVHGMNSLACVTIRYPHSAYAGLVSCLMEEWNICRFVLNIGPLLEPIEETLHTKFLPAILGCNITINHDLRNFLALTVKASGVAIQNPTLIVDSLFHSSQDATSYLSGSLLCNEPTCTHHHSSAICNAAASS
ncbi:hypothetical protein ACHAW6_003899 [Cyclotella cf. meneghiniana]